MSEFTLRIEGMHCGACVRRVSQALASTPGLTVEEVRLGAARLRSKPDSVKELAPADSAIAAIAKAGFAATLDQ
jgi:copper chaperone